MFFFFFGGGGSVSLFVCCCCYLFDCLLLLLFFLFFFLLVCLLLFVVVVVLGGVFFFFHLRAHNQRVDYSGAYNWVTGDLRCCTGLERQRERKEEKGTVEAGGGGAHKSRFNTKQLNTSK